MKEHEMKVIAKIVNAGKTTEMIEEVMKRTECFKLVISSESSPIVVVRRMHIRGRNQIQSFTVCGNECLCPTPEILVAYARTAYDAERIIDAAADKGIKFGVVGLDVNNVLTSQEWLNLSMKLEAQDIEVFGTQSVIRPSVQKKEVSLDALIRSQAPVAH